MLRWYFGDNWLKKYIYNTRSETFLNQIGSIDVLERKRLRRIFLAEILYNLQEVRNFALCWDELYSGKIESAYAVLYMAKLLLRQQSTSVWGFVLSLLRNIRGAGGQISYLAFLMARGRLGRSKVSKKTTDVTIAKLKENLSDAKEQLPKRSPGFVFVKVHKAHADNEYFSNEMGEARR